MKYLIVIILVLYGLRLIFRLVFPYAIRQFIKKNQQKNSAGQFTNRPTGQVKVEQNQNSNFDNNIEDIDFEEVK